MNGHAIAFLLILATAGAFTLASLIYLAKRFITVKMVGWFFRISFPLLAALALVAAIVNPNPMIFAHVVALSALTLMAWDVDVAWLINR